RREPENSLKWDRRSAFVVCQLAATENRQRQAMVRPTSASAPAFRQEDMPAVIVTVFLLTHHKNRERIRQHRAPGGSSTAPSLWRRAPCGRRGRWWRRRAVLRRHRQDVFRLRIQRQRLGATHRLEILLHGEGCRIVFLDDRHG